jgi:hypothetical protein
MRRVLVIVLLIAASAAVTLGRLGVLHGETDVSPARRAA